MILLILALMMQPIEIEFIDESGVHHFEDAREPSDTLEVGDTWEDGGGIYLDPNHGGAGVLLDADGDTISYTREQMIVLIEKDGTRFMPYMEPNPFWWETENGRTKRTLLILACGLAVGTIAGMAIKW